MSKNLILSVYFNGTDFRLSERNFSGFFFYQDQGDYKRHRFSFTEDGDPGFFEQEVPNDLNQQLQSSTLISGGNKETKYVKMGFAGCGITHGTYGANFGDGVIQQAEEVQAKVNDYIKQGYKVTVNAYGHSRGGISPLLLAKKLGGYAMDMVEVNLALLDPVPGDSPIIAKADVLGILLANQAMDLTNCRNLNNVLTLYPEEEILGLIGHFHTPIRPKYPAGCKIKEIIIPGIHSRTQSIRYHRGLPQFNKITFIAFYYIRNFLQTHGTKFNTAFEKFYVETVLFESKNEQLLLLNCYESNLENPQPEAVRTLHSTSNYQFTAGGDRLYFNSEHRKIAAELQPETIAIKQMNLFKALLTDIENGMSATSRNSHKGQILKAFAEEINSLDRFADDELLHNALRNVTALSLQRDRNAWSLFSTTASGLTLVKLLQQPKYHDFAQLIQGSCAHPVRYRDLRSYVTSKNNKGFFAVKNRQALYGIFSKLDNPEEKVVLVDHQTNFVKIKPS